MLHGIDELWQVDLHAHTVCPVASRGGRPPASRYNAHRRWPASPRDIPEVLRRVALNGSFAFGCEIIRKRCAQRFRGVPVRRRRRFSASRWGVVAGWGSGCAPGVDSSVWNCTLSRGAPPLSAPTSTAGALGWRGSPLAPVYGVRMVLDGGRLTICFSEDDPFAFGGRPRDDSGA